MDKATSREEIENRIKDIDNEIETLRQANDGAIDFIQIGKLEDEKETLEKELEEIVVETNQNSGVNLEQARKDMQEEEEQEQEFTQAQREEERMAQEEAKQKEKEEEEKEMDDGEDSLISTEEEPKPLDYWEYKSGILIIPCDGSRKALQEKTMTREEFIDRLGDSVSVIKEAGKADEFFKGKSDEWEKIRNSKEEFQKVIILYGNDLPDDIDTTQVYVLYENDEDTMHRAENEATDIENEEEQDTPKQRDIEVIKKHLSSEVAQRYSVMPLKEALELAEKGMLNEKEVESIVEDVEKGKEEVGNEDATLDEEHDTEEGKTAKTIKEVVETMIEEAGEENLREEIELEVQEQKETVEAATLGEELINSIIREEDMIDDVDPKALASVSAQMRDGLENGIDNDNQEPEIEEHLPGYPRKI